MACCEHSCRDCGHEWEGNQTRPACPECLSRDVLTVWDEWPDREDADDA